LHLQREDLALDGFSPQSYLADLYYPIVQGQNKATTWNRFQLFSTIYRQASTLTLCIRAKPDCLFDPAQMRKILRATNVLACQDTPDRSLTYPLSLHAPCSRNAITPEFRRLGRPVLGIARMCCVSKGKLDSANRVSTKPLPAHRCSFFLCLPARGELRVSSRPSSGEARAPQRFPWLSGVQCR